MNGMFLKNGEGELGLAVAGEMRKIKGVVYLPTEKNLYIEFDNGETDTLLTPIDPSFEKSLFVAKKIFIAHFQDEEFTQPPLGEYHVSLGT